MAISGIVIRLDDDEAVRPRTLERLEEDPRVALGVAERAGLPAVIETESAREDRACWEWIASLPGVVGLDLVCVHYDVDGEAVGQEA